MTIQPGSLVLVHRRWAGSRMIGWGQKFRFPPEFAHWTHCGIAVSKLSLVEALGRGVQRTPFANYDKEGVEYRVVPIECSVEQRAAVLRFAEHAVNTRYGFSEIFSLGTYLATGCKWRITRNNQLICSALAAEALSRTDAIFPEEPLWCLPAHLAQYYNAKWRGSRANV